MSEFWDWAVAAYARPGVAEACLDLQDSYGQNVPLLLWAVWRGGDVGDAVDLATLWESEVIGHLRHARRNLKRFGGYEALRERIKADELDAERTLMTALEGVMPAPEAPAEARLRAVVARWGGDVPQAALTRLLAALGDSVTTR